jgi:hypothetical protein
MNALDALVLDGLPESEITKPLREVWIAIRTDGVPDTRKAFHVLLVVVLGLQVLFITIHRTRLTGAIPPGYSPRQFKGMKSG